MRGYFEIGVYHPKYEQNIGTLWRSAYQLGASGLFTIGQRYRRQPGDTVHAMRHIPLRTFLTFDDWRAQRPAENVLIGIEMGGIPLSEFRHPHAATYLLGAEDDGLPPDVLASCHTIVSLEAIRMVSYNLAVAGTLVMYDRVFPRKE